MRIRSSLLSLIVLLVVLWSPEVAQASCAGEPPPPAIALGESDAVFQGRVASIGPYIPLISDFAGRRVTFEVSRYWKGELDGPRAVLRNWRTSADYEFEAGREYLVYARRWNTNDPGAGGGALNASGCGRTSLLADARADLRALGPGMRPPSEPGDNSWDVWTVVLPAVLLLLGVRVLLLATRWKRRRATARDNSRTA